MNNYTREYTFIVPFALPSSCSYTKARDAVRDLMSNIIGLINQLRVQGKIGPTDLTVEWCEIALDNLRSEYRVSLFSTAGAAAPEIVEAIRDLVTKQEFTVLIRTADMQDVFCSGKPELVGYFMNTYMSDGNNNFTSADVGAKNAYDKQNCRTLVANPVVDDREVDLSAPETKTVVLHDLGIRNKLYQLKSATISGDTVVCKLEGPRGEITHTVPVNREVWSKWPIVVKEAIDEETI